MDFYLKQYIYTNLELRPCHQHVHLPSLKIKAADAGRLILNEFDLRLNESDDENINLNQRRRLPQVLMDWCERIYVDGRFCFSFTTVDEYWVNHNRMRFIPTQLDTLVSYLDHISIVVEDGYLDYLIQVVKVCTLVGCRNAGCWYIEAVTRLVGKMHKSLSDFSCNLVLSHALLLFPPKNIRDILISLGADVEISFALSDPVLVAAGTGDLEYVRIHLKVDDTSLTNMDRPLMIGFPIVGEGNVCTLMEAAMLADDVEMMDLLVDLHAALTSRCLETCVERSNFNVLRRWHQLTGRGIPAECYSRCMNLDAVNFLHELSCNVTLALQYYYFDTKIMQRLHSLGASVDQRVFRLFMLNLYELRRDISQCGVLDAVKCFLELPRNLTVQWISDMKPHEPVFQEYLSYAVHCNNGVLVRLLLSYCSSSTMANRSGMALMECSKRVNLGIATMLVHRGADVNFHDLIPRTPLMEAALYDDDCYRYQFAKKIYMQWLIRKGASLTDRDDVGMTALDLLAESESDLRSELTIYKHNLV